MLFLPRVYDGVHLQRLVIGCVKDPEADVHVQDVPGVLEKVPSIFKVKSKDPLFEYFSCTADPDVVTDREPKRYTVSTSIVLLTLSTIILNIKYFGEDCNIEV